MTYVKDLFSPESDMIVTDDVNGYFLQDRPTKSVWKISRRLSGRLYELGIKNAYFDFVNYDNVDSGVMVGLICPVPNTEHSVVAKIHILNLNELKMSNVHEDILKQVESCLKDFHKKNLVN